MILRDVTERWQSEETLKQLQLENVYLQEEIKTRQTPDHIVGDSSAMREVFPARDPCQTPTHDNGRYVKCERIGARASRHHPP